MNLVHESAIEQLRQKGYKITPQRQEILKTLEAAPGPQSVEDIHRQIAERYPNMSMDTVYRNIAVLLELGIVSKLNFQDGKNRFEINCAGKHHHHLVCLTCGLSEAVEICPFNTLDQQRIAREKKFEITGHSFEIFGHCAKCREKYKL
ncbi:MAG: Peroxide-responsive repressor PerR [Pelotomaculum sp. PtaB.Bin104]|nr:MAG: Peroxide-responsive repressor PerR [Pelotomaculum sp. PtaB.Bin104]